MLVDLEHGIMICVSMELQQRGGSQSECELSIEKYGVCVLGFVFFFFFDRWLDVFGSVWIELIVTETKN